MTNRPMTIGTWATAVLLATTCVVAGEEPVIAKGEVELSDVAGDVPVSDETSPPLDVVALAIRSDGRHLRIEATLAEKPGNSAETVVEVFIDSDTDPATGIGEFSGRPAGFEYEAAVLSCLGYENGAACAGSLGDGVTEHFGAMNLKRYEGDNPYGPSESIVSALGIGDARESERTPVADRTVTAVIHYADLGLEPGQTIGLLARERVSAFPDEGLFPLVLLTLE